MNDTIKKTKYYRQQHQHHHPQKKAPLKWQHYLGMLYAISYGLAYGFLTYTLLTVAYDLFLSQVLTAVFATTVPVSWLILPAVATGLVYWTIGQFEFNAFIDQILNNQYSKAFSVKNLILFSLGLLVAFFIAIEFIEFLPAFLFYPLVIGIMAGSIHFTVFYMNADRSFESLRNLFKFNQTFSLDCLDDILTLISLAAPLIAIVTVVFITGLFHYAVLALFSAGVMAVMVKKWRDPYYQQLDIFRRIYATIDTTVREYAALIIHCIGEGAIPAAAASHTTTALSRVLAQTSGLVATANEYFCDLHAISGDQHYFRIFENISDKSMFLCRIYEHDNDAIRDHEPTKAFYFNSTSKDCIRDAYTYLHDQFNGTFIFLETKKAQLISEDHLSDKKMNYLEAWLGAKIKYNWSFAWITLGLLSTFVALSLIYSFHVITLPLFIVSLGADFLMYRYILQRQFGPIITQVQAHSCCPSDSTNIDDEHEHEHEHSHGLDYKPVLGALLFPNQYISETFNRACLQLIIVFLSINVVLSLSLTQIQTVLMFPVIYIVMLQITNVFLWILYADKKTKCNDIYDTLNWLQNPVNWLKGLLFSLIAMVAVCIGINGGTEFISHLAIASSVAGPMIIGIFIFSAILTEGVWINDRLNQAFNQLMPEPSSQLKEQSESRSLFDPQNLKSSKISKEIFQGIDDLSIESAKSAAMP